MHAEGRRCARGFTLIEVLAALVIVALGMLGVIEAVSQTARNGTYLRERTLAHWVGMNVITERRLLPNPPDVAQSSDEVEFAGERWRWSLTVTQTEVESMRRLDVTVRRAEAPETATLATVTGFYGTALRPSSGRSLVWEGEPADPGEGGGDDEDDGGGDEDGDGDDGGENGGGEEPPPPDDPEPPTEDDDGSGDQEP